MKEQSHGHLSHSNRQTPRRNARIQCLPHKRHSLTESIDIKGPIPDNLRPSQHSRDELCIRILRRGVHTRQHESIVKHMRQGAIRAREERTREIGVHHDDAETFVERGR